MARINTNIAALNSLRHLGRTEQEMSKTLERLSSGKRLNSAADGPASLVIAEKMNAQVSSIDQAIRNSETSVSMIQTAEGALNEVSSILVTLRQLAVSSANSGVNDEQMLQANQSEMDNLLASLQRIAETTQFGTRSLLDGSKSVSGVAIGDGIEFINAGVNTKPSPAEGYKVNITQVATRAMSVGTRPLKLEDAFANYVLTENGKNVALNVRSDKELTDSIERVIQSTQRELDPVDKAEGARVIQKLIATKLQDLSNSAGLNIDVFVYKPTSELENTVSDPSVNEQVLKRMGSWPGELKDLADEEVLVIRHRDFGSQPTFSITTSVDELFSEDAASNQVVYATSGRDVEGTIGGNPEQDAGGEAAIGKGQLLTSAPGSTAAGLTIRYTNDTDDVLYQVVNRIDQKMDGVFLKEKDNDALVGDSKPDMHVWNKVIPEIEGYVHITQNALAFQVGPNQGQQVKISIGSTRPDTLGRHVKNSSDIQSLAEVSVLSSQAAQDSISVVDAALDETSKLRAQLGAFQKNALESNLNSLGVSKERLMSARSLLEDADMAAEMSSFVKNQILLSAGTAMLAQANQSPKNVLQLLNNGG